MSEVLHCKEAWLYTCFAVGTIISSAVNMQAPAWHQIDGHCKFLKDETRCTLWYLTAQRRKNSGEVEENMDTPLQHVNLAAEVEASCRRW